MSFAKLPNAVVLAALSFTIVSWLPGSRAQAQPVHTLRYDLPETPLFIFNLGVLLDFGFPVEPAEIVKTRFHLVFNTQTSAGNFPAQDIALRLEPPIPSPIPGDPGLLNKTFTGTDFGWSGTGTFTFDGETDDLDGVALPAPPGAAFLLYAIEIHHARRITDPGDLTPIGGQFVGSHVEVDYVLIPEPSILLAGTLPMMLLQRRRSRGGAPRQRARESMR
jgi:hypothetical protein